MKKILKNLNVYKELDYRSKIAADLERQASIVKRLTELPIEPSYIIALIKLAKNSYSELGQDLVMALLGNFKRTGTFIEIGAGDGANCSNTKLLEDNYNWQGVISEPNPKYRKKLSNRKCIINYDIVHSNSKDTLYINDLSSLSYVSRTKMVKRGSYVSTISLNDLLKEHFDSHNVEIDYVSIDTEGHEEEILSVFPFNKWNISYFIIEHNFKSKKSIDKIMFKAGYTCFLETWSMIDSYYFHSSKIETLRNLNLIN